jgi:hypothetical protein
MADVKQDKLDRVLDAALAEYAAVEPREGLENRVLANLRAEQARVPDRAWRRWSLMALAALVIVAITLAWRSGKPSHPVAASHPSSPLQNPAPPSASNGGNRVLPPALRPKRKSAYRSQPEIVMAASRKLEQFPSPQPLSEQELALAKYVSEFPQEATLIAQAQDEYEKEIQQKMKDERSDAERYGSDQQER